MYISLPWFRVYFVQHFTQPYEGKVFFCKTQPANLTSSYHKEVLAKWNLSVTFRTEFQHLLLRHFDQIFETSNLPQGNNITLIGKTTWGKLFQWPRLASGMVERHSKSAYGKSSTTFLRCGSRKPPDTQNWSLWSVSGQGQEHRLTSER